MPYRILVPEPVADKIRAVRPSIVADVQTQLARLGERIRLATRIEGGEFDGLMAFEFRVDRLPVSRKFAVLFEFDANEQDLHVLDFGCLVGAPPAIAPPSFEIE